MDLILDKNNIELAYRNIKSNKGSNTAGVDGLTIKDISELDNETL
jgi:retron-type reverse transcriptase